MDDKDRILKRTCEASVNVCASVFTEEPDSDNTGREKMSLATFSFKFLCKILFMWVNASRNNGP